MWTGQIPLRKDRDFSDRVFKEKKIEENPAMLFMRHAPKTKMTGKAWKQTDGERESRKCLNKRGEEKYISDNIVIQVKNIN